MGFIKQFFGKNEPSEEDLKEFLNRKVEEGIHLFDIIYVLIITFFIVGSSVPP